MRPPFLRPAKLLVDLQSLAVHLLRHPGPLARRARSRARFYLSRRWRFRLAPRPVRPRAGPLACLRESSVAFEEVAIRDQDVGSRATDHGPREKGLRVGALSLLDEPEDFGNAVGVCGNRLRSPCSQQASCGEVHLREGGDRYRSTVRPLLLLVRTHPGREVAGKQVLEGAHLVEGVEQVLLGLLQSPLELQHRLELPARIAELLFAHCLEEHDDLLHRHCGVTQALQCHVELLLHPGPEAALPVGRRAPAVPQQHHREVALAEVMVDDVLRTPDPPQRILPTDRKEHHPRERPSISL